MITGETIYYIQITSVGSCDPLPFLLAYISVLGSSGLLVALFSQMTRSAEQENKYRLELKTRSLTERHNNEILEAYRQLQTLRHDFKQHV